MLAELGIRRVRIVSRPNVEWYVERCWSNNILVRAVVVDGYYCPADEYVVLNEANLEQPPMTPQRFAEELQLHRRQYPNFVLIAGALGDNLADGIDAADYLNQVRLAGGLTGYDGVAIHYPRTAARMAAFKKAAANRAIHVTEYFKQPRELSDYMAQVIYPHARTADLFCINSGMRDGSWTEDMGLFNVDWSPRPLLRQWLSLVS